MSRSQRQLYCYKLLPQESTIHRQQCPAPCGYHANACGGHIQSLQREQLLHEGPTTLTSTYLCSCPSFLLYLLRCFAPRL